MFAVTLTFADNKALAKQYMEAHNAWLKRGFDDKVFLLAGSIKAGVGGYLLVNEMSLAAVKARVDSDPFVVEGVVSAEIKEISVNKVDQRLAFLS